MKKITAFLLCVVLFCSCAAVCSAEDGEKAFVKALEAPVCVGYAYNSAELKVVGGYVTDDPYVRVKTSDGAEGWADERWVALKQNNTVAQVRNERVEIFTEMLKKDDEVEVISKGSDVTKVRVNGNEGEIETRFLRFEGESEYEPWAGYAAAEAMLFNNPWMRDAGGKIRIGMYGNTYSIPNAVPFKKNTPITVYGYLNECCLVEIEGQIGYLETKFVLTEPIDYTLWG